MNQQKVLYPIANTNVCVFSAVQKEFYPMKDHEFPRD